MDADFWKGFTVGQALKPILWRAKGEPVSYLYNGIVYPAAPDWDDSTYPYLMVTSGGQLFALSKPIAPVGALGVLSVNQPCLKATLKNVYDTTKDDAWSEWEAFESTSGSGNIMWASHTLTKSDGITVVIKGTKPEPVTLPLVLFDGEVTTTNNEYGLGASGSIHVLCKFVVGDTLTVTINGHTETYTVELNAEGEDAHIGNAGLNGNDTTSPDDGGDMCMTYASFYNGERTAYFYTRTPGTYSVKVVLVKYGAQGRSVTT